MVDRLPVGVIVTAHDGHADARRVGSWAIVRIDWNEKRFVIGNVGNVEIRVVGAESLPSFVVRRGILGSNAPKPRVTEHAWDPRFLFVLHTDGLKGRWRWNQFAHLAQRPADELATTMLSALARDDDDATVVVLKEVRP